MAGSRKKFGNKGLLTTFLMLFSTLWRAYSWKLTHSTSDDIGIGGGIDSR